MTLPSKYHDELRYQLDMADNRVRLLLGCIPVVPENVRAAMAWRHMLIQELQRVQLEEWDHDYPN